MGRRRFRGFSAGSHPKGAVHPIALELLAHMKLPTEGLRSKSWDEFAAPGAPRLDFVIALCDTLDGQQCPDFGDKAVTGAWPLPDPAKFTGSDAERAILLNELYASLRRRLDIFISLPVTTLDRLALKARLDEIGGDPTVAYARSH